MKQRLAIEEDAPCPELWEFRRQERANALADQDTTALGGEWRRAVDHEVLASGHCEAEDLALCLTCLYSLRLNMRFGRWNAGFARSSLLMYVHEARYRRKRDRIVRG